MSLTQEKLQIEQSSHKTLSVINIRDFLYNNFKELTPMFDDVGLLDIEKLMKKPYPALIGIIVGQKITYKKAKQLRKFIYETMETAQKEMGDKIDGTDFLPHHINHMKNVLSKLENWPIIERVNDFLKNKPINYLDKDNSNIKENIYSLQSIKGIGPWTIQSTMLCSLLDKCYSDCDVFPVNDKFLQNSLIRLHNIYVSKGQNSPLLPKYKNQMINKILLSDVKQISEKWSPYRGIITWYFWRWF